jgi:hypothetical protein
MSEDDPKGRPLSLLQEVEGLQLSEGEILLSRSTNWGVDPPNMDIRRDAIPPLLGLPRHATTREVYNSLWLQTSYLRH